MKSLPKLKLRTQKFYLICLAIVAGFVMLFKINHISLKETLSQLPRGPDSQLQRHWTLKAVCDATKALRPNDTLEYLQENPALLSKMIYDDEHKLIYCYIAKVSTTQWKTLMGTLAGRLPANLSKKQLSKMKLYAHDGSIHHFMSQLSGPEIRHRLETYTSFLFVRHPLERLVSGYRNKFRSALMNQAWQIKHSLDMIAHSQGREPWQVAEEGAPGHVTFEQFARWVADAPPANLTIPYQEGPNDEHWRPMTELCHPCSVPYTVLGRTETMQDDAKMLLKLANITSVSLPERTSHSNTSTLTGDLVASLAPETQWRVLRKYLQDFVLFGYQPENVFPDNSKLQNSTRALFDELLSRV